MGKAMSLKHLRELAEHISREMDLKAENADLKADNAALREALRWMVNVANDVGKSGGKPYTDEWKDATDAGMAALAGEEKPPGEKLLTAIVNARPKVAGEEKP
jgi:hypothetical protein